MVSEGRGSGGDKETGGQGDRETGRQRERGRAANHQSPIINHAEVVV